MARKKIQKTKIYSVRLFEADFEYLKENLGPMTPTQFIRTAVAFHVKQLKEKTNGIKPESGDNLDNLFAEALGLNG